jgi:hypothetical protein
MGNTRPGAYVVGGKLFFRLKDRSTISCECIASPYAELVAEACGHGIEQEGAQLGFLLNGPFQAWCITAKNNEGKLLPLAFSLEQAREIARRITEALGK